MNESFFRRLAWVVVLITTLHAAGIAATFQYTANLTEAQKHLCALRLGKARALAQAEMAAHPDNVAADYLLEYVDFYKIMVDQDKRHYENYEKLKIKTIERMKKLPDSDPARLCVLGSLHFQGAFVKSLFDDYVSAAFEFRTAYQLLAQNYKNYPAYLGTQKDLGALTALIGTFPDSYKWIMNAVGLKGDYDGGINMLNYYMDHAAKEPLIEQQQAAIFIGLIYLNFGADKQTAMRFYHDHAKEYTSNLMQNYVLAYITGKCGRNDEAIAILNARPASADYESIPFMNYLAGSYMLYKLDPDAAIWFKKYLFTNPANALKETYQRLSWCALLQNDSARFLIYHRMMQKTSKQEGSEELLINADLDKQVYPNIILVKARLLFDGGYYQKAEQLLAGFNPALLPSTFQKIEYEYRMGRLAHEQKNYARAITCYAKTITLANGIDTYMAPNACLQLGLIYKTLNYKATAIEYLDKVATYKNYDYKSSVQQKAKAALIQLE